MHHLDNILMSHSIQPGASLESEQHSLRTSGPPSLLYVFSIHSPMLPPPPPVWYFSIFMQPDRYSAGSNFPERYYSFGHSSTVIFSTAHAAPHALLKFSAQTQPSSPLAHFGRNLNPSSPLESARRSICTVISTVQTYKQKSILTSPSDAT